MGKFIITEEEKKRIIGLYEQSNTPTDDRECVNAVKDITKQTSMKLYPDGNAAYLGDVKNGISVGCTSSGENMLGFKVSTNDKENEVINVTKDYNLGESGSSFEPTNWRSVPIQGNKLVELINKLKPILGF
jgi:hypothetical protein